MNVTNPTISVVIPLYNKEKTVKRALDSIMKQTVLPQEIIVVDDGSTDGSRAVVEQEHNPLIRLLGQENSGVSAARNRGIREARGALIAFLDADDEWEPGYLSEIVHLIEIAPGCGVYSTSYKIVIDENLTKPIRLKKLIFESNQVVFLNYFQVASRSHPPIWSSAVVIKKECFGKIGGFPEGVTSGEDLLTWAKLAINYKIAYSLQPLSKFHIDSKNTLYPKRVFDKNDIVGKELYKLYVSNKCIPGLRQYIGLWHKMRASVFLRTGAKQLAILEIFKSIFFNPLSIKIYLFIPFIFFNNKFSNKFLK